MSIVGYSWTRDKKKREKRELSLETLQSIVVLRKEGELKNSYHAVNYSLQRAAQTGSIKDWKKSWRPRCNNCEEDKTPVSTMKRQLQDAGLEKPFLTLANKNKTEMGKIAQTLDTGRLEEGVVVVVSDQTEEHL